MPKSDIDIFSFLDYRAFLQRWFDARKARDPRFSHRLFARLAGQKSPSLLLQIIQRKRNLTPTSAEGFARVMKLDDEQSRFFYSLVDFDQAANDERKNDAWARIAAERRFRAARRIDGDALTYLSSTQIPAIRELAALPTFRDDPRWVASMMRPAITPGEARSALDLLFDLGMLTRDEDNHARVTDVSVVTPREVGTLAVHNYHRDACERARVAISTVAPEQRHFLGVTVAIPLELMPVLKEQLNAVQARLLDLCDAHPGLKRRVVQINLHLYPLTEDA